MTARLAVDVRARFVAAGSEPFTVDVDLLVREGETLVVLGPSGSGKTLLLETVGGFHDHEGRIVRDDRDITDASPEDREFGVVFQDYALFPHMTVRENVAFGARYHDDVRDPDELLARFGVANLAERAPTTLSGGERQRVALARALAVRPAALLLDEPLSALDAPTRQGLRDDLAAAVADVTALYVTHDRTTARALADRVAVMRGGRIVQSAPPATVFESPATPFVARFVGANCLPTTVPLPVDTGGAERFAVRPEHVDFGAADPDFAATVERVVREDAAFRVTLSVAGERFDAYAADPPAPGESVGVSLSADRVTLFDGEAARTDADADRRT